MYRCASQRLYLGRMTAGAVRMAIQGRPARQGPRAQREPAVLLALRFISTAIPARKGIRGRPARPARPARPGTRAVQARLAQPARLFISMATLARKAIRGRPARLDRPAAQGQLARQVQLVRKALSGRSCSWTMGRPAMTERPAR